MSKKTFIITGMMLLMAAQSQPQAPASIVYDPTNAAQIGSVLETIKELKSLQEEWKSNQEFLNKVVQEGKEVKRLISLLESLVCATDEFDIYIGVVGDLTLCNRKLEIDITLGKLEGISEKIKSLVTGAYVLSQFETIASLKDLNDELEEGIHQINRINTDLRVDVVKTLNTMAGESYGYEEVSWSMDAGI